MPDDIDSTDEYTDSETNLVVLHNGQPLRRLRAVIHWASNVGLHVRLRSGGLVAVNHLEDDTYVVEIPNQP